jgi:hypothetical protein
MNTLLEAAREYCRRGVPVFWLRGKHPLGGHGHKDATADFTQLVEMYRSTATGLGRPIPADMFVLDVDVHKGGAESLAELERTHGALPETLEQLTGSGGRHLVYATPVEIRQGANFLPGLDTRAAGRGYIAVEPSIHPMTGKPYRWIRRCAPVAAPRWLIDLVRVPERAPVPPYVPPHTGSFAASKRERYAKAVLRGVARDVADAVNGHRNDALNKAWFRCSQFRDVLDREEVRATLRAAAQSTGLSEREIEKVLR